MNVPCAMVGEGAGDRAMGNGGEKAPSGCQGMISPSDSVL